MPFPAEGWPPRPPTGRRIIRFFAEGIATANFYDNAFLFNSGNQAIATLGEGDANRLVIVTIDAAGPAGNDYQIEVVRPTSGHPAALSATLSGQLITVSLATLASGELDAVANTATLVAAAIGAIGGVSAVANGTGAGALTATEQAKNFFAGGGLVLPTPYVPPGGASTIAHAGDRYKGGGPLGGGRRDVDPNQDVYNTPFAHVWASTIVVQNDDGAPANTIEVSFDGINVHGEVRGGEKVEFWYRHEAGIAIRLTAGAPAFRVQAW
jgi:hypothetical protein